jgi:hypothetical protein
MSHFLRRPGSKARWHYTIQAAFCANRSGFGIFDFSSFREMGQALGVIQRFGRAEWL